MQAKDCGRSQRRRGSGSKPCLHREAEMDKAKLKLILQIYLSFLKLGCISFGGGYSMIPLIEREVVENRKWVDKNQIIDIFAVSESLPGAIALNSSAFVGYSIAGIPGALAALVGNMTPSVIIVLALSAIYSVVNHNPFIQAAFRGIYPVIVALIAFAAFKIGKLAIKDGYTLLLAAVAFTAAQFMGISPIPLIILGALSGIAYGLVIPLRCTIKRTSGRKRGKGL